MVKCKVAAAIHRSNTHLWGLHHIHTLNEINRSASTFRMENSFSFKLLNVRERERVAVVCALQSNFSAMLHTSHFTLISSKTQTKEHIHTRTYYTHKQTQIRTFAHSHIM